MIKKFQEKTKLSKGQILKWGKYIGKDFKKLVRFKLSVKGRDVSKDLKGKDIGKAIQNMEKDKFLNEIAVRKKPKKFKDIYNALPSDLKKRVYNLKNYDQRRDAHPEGNVLKHTIAVTNRALKTGDIDFALSALFHDIGKDSTAKLHPKKGFWTHYGHERIAQLVREKKIEGIRDIRDESNREGIRVAIDLRSGIEPETIKRQLFKYTSIESSFGFNTLAIVDNKPKTCNLKDFLDQFLKFRENVVTKKTKFDLKKAENRAHILIGLSISVENLDKVIKIIRSSKT